MASFTMAISFITANAGGSTKRTTVDALFFMLCCTGNINGPFSFKTAGAPVYQSDITAVLVAYYVEMAILVGYAFYLRACNRKKGLILPGRLPQVGLFRGPRALSNGYLHRHL